MDDDHVTTPEDAMNALAWAIQSASVDPVSWRDDAERTVWFWRGAWTTCPLSPSILRALGVGGMERWERLHHRYTHQHDSQLIADAFDVLVADVSRMAGAADLGDAGTICPAAAVFAEILPAIPSSVSTPEMVQKVVASTLFMLFFGDESNVMIPHIGALPAWQQSLLNVVVPGTLSPAPREVLLAMHSVTQTTQGVLQPAVGRWLASATASPPSDDELAVLAQPLDAASDQIMSIVQSVAVDGLVSNVPFDIVYLVGLCVIGSLDVHLVEAAVKALRAKFDANNRLKGLTEDVIVALLHRSSMVGFKATFRTVMLLLRGVAGLPKPVSTWTGDESWNELGEYLDGVAREIAKATPVLNIARKMLIEPSLTDNNEALLSELLSLLHAVINNPMAELLALIGPSQYGMVFDGTAEPLLTALENPLDRDAKQRWTASAVENDDTNTATQILHIDRDVQHMEDVFGNVTTAFQAFMLSTVNNPINQFVDSFFDTNKLSPFTRDVVKHVAVMASSSDRIIAPNVRAFMRSLRRGKMFDLVVQNYIGSYVAEQTLQGAMRPGAALAIKRVRDDVSSLKSHPVSTFLKHASKWPVVFRESVKFVQRVVDSVATYQLDAVDVAHKEEWRTIGEAILSFGSTTDVPYDHTLAAKTLLPFVLPIAMFNILDTVKTFLEGADPDAATHAVEVLRGEILREFRQNTRLSIHHAGASAMLALGDNSPMRQVPLTDRFSIVVPRASSSADPLVTLWMQLRPAFSHRVQPSDFAARINVVNLARNVVERHAELLKIPNMPVSQALTLLCASSGARNEDVTRKIAAILSTVNLFPRAKTLPVDGLLRELNTLGEGDTFEIERADAVAAGNSAVRRAQAILNIAPNLDHFALDASTRWSDVSVARLLPEIARVQRGGGSRLVNVDGNRVQLRK